GVDVTQAANLTLVHPVACTSYKHFQGRSQSLQTVISRTGDENDLDDASKLARASEQLISLQICGDTRASIAISHLASICQSSRLGITLSRRCVADEIEGFGNSARSGLESGS
ncbi:hypothetical protein CTAM01_17367, partial [Colletotrichum tamarilloi]